MKYSYSVKAVALFGIVGNIFLLAIKLLVGLATHSQAMIADAVNSASDIFSSLMTYIGNKITQRPCDKEHPYGHGKAEYIFSMIISMVFFWVSLLLFRSSLNRFLNHQVVDYSVWLLIVAVVTIVVKLMLYLKTIGVAKRQKSLLAHANAVDHRNDIMIAFLTLVSAIAANYRVYYIDAIFGMIIAFWIGYSGVEIFISSYHKLMDRALAKSITDEMVRVVEQIDGVDHLDSLVAKSIGVNYLLIVKVSVDGNFSVFRGHDITYQIKRCLLAFELIDDVVVHLNPRQLHPQKNLLR